MTKQQIASALGYTRHRITSGPAGTGTLIKTMWKVPRRDGRSGKGYDRDIIDDLPDFTPEQIAKAQEIIKRNKS